MPLVLAALLALPIPAAQAAGCTAFDVLFGSPNKRGIAKEIGSYFVSVPDSNFLTGAHYIYIDDKCEVPPDPKKRKFDYELFSPGAAFAKNGRKAMEICELNMDQTVAQVERAVAGDFRYKYFYCEVGEREGPRRERREFLFGTQYDGEDAEGALARCQRSSAGHPKHSQPNYVEPRTYGNFWACYRTWRVSKSYLKRVGA